MHSRSNWNLDVLVFKERGKPEYLEKNFSEQGREQTTNSTLIWHWHQDSNAGHIGGRPVLSLLCHPHWQTFLHLSTGTQIKILHFLSQKAKCTVTILFAPGFISPCIMMTYYEKYCHLLLPSFYLTNFFFFLAESHWFIPATLSSGDLSSWLLSGDFCWTCFSHSLAVLGVPTTTGLTGVGVGVEISAEKDSWGIW